MAAIERPIRRILFSESSPNLGGQELQLLAQARGLMDRGIDCLLLCRPRARIADEAARLGVPVRHIAFRNSLDFSSLLPLRQVFTEFRPDAVLCHSGHDANNCAVVARTLPHRPVLLRARTYQHGIPHAWTYNRLFDRTLVPSIELRNRILANPRINSERIHVLYPGIDFESLDKTSGARLDAILQSHLDRLPPRRILHVAMLRREKGHMLMLDVIAALSAKHPDIGYVVAGEGEMHTPLKARAADLGIADRVALVGMVSQVSALMRHAELLVMPSEYEPLGMAQIEALALELPVVASHVGGIPETICDGVTGQLVPSGDRDAWVAALGSALSAPGVMQDMARTGSKLVRTRFGKGTNLDKLLDHMTSCLEHISILPES